MNKDKINEAMAQLEGLDLTEEYYSGEGVRHEHWLDIPDYLDPLSGHGYIERILLALDRDDLIKYFRQLTFVVRGYSGYPVNTDDYIAVQLASASQKAEAVLRAKGMWE